MEKEILIQYQEIVNFNLLSDIDKKMINKAQEISNVAYAPYSQFQVGASVLLENNLIITGNNQENSSFPCGICAERVALFTAKANYKDINIQKIAITAFSNNFNLEEPVGPCGLCRQVLLEYELKQNTDIEVLLFNSKKIIKIAKAQYLLPLYFKENKLKRT